MKHQLTDQQYATEKLTFAAYLIATDKARLVGTHQISNDSKVMFLLSPPPGQEDITSFFNGTATVSALQYSEALNTLKSAAYEGRRRNGRL